MFKDGLFRGKRILITGGGSGLGKGMAERFLMLGAEVIICGRRRSVCEATAADMFEHADRGDLIERLVQIPVIKRLNRDPVRDPTPPHQVTRKSELLITQGAAETCYTIVFDCVGD